MTQSFEAQIEMLPRMVNESILREIEAYKHISKGYDIGAVDYLFKPVNPMILKSKVKVFLALRHKNELESLVAKLNQAHNALKESTYSLIQCKKMRALGPF